MRNIKLTIEYDGSRYQGWTRLGKDESGNTISNKIIEVLRKMTGEYLCELHCGCRTEVGVHAYLQVANFKTECSMTTKEIQHYLNRYLPMDIAVTKVEEKPERFHAQLNALSKTYVYRITIDEVPSVFDRRYIYHSFKIPDKKVMQQAALSLIGTHDFRNFSSVKKSKSTVKTIYDLDIYADIEEMLITIKADDFLHNMARILIGTLLDIGLGIRKKEEIEEIFAGNLPASNPCDPKGLYLQEVSYE
ncbi:tRNA pseudouridine synthase A [Clostridiaceae bacterium 68-1-5]|uniref:tRNA pseudouridine synthase A n=1 Tax=Suipraeoptans intestinalis TaxID=2606628 RepID=A0A6N7V2E3_9FIRM|nr:tRNA pseudouridine synthase A [Suipraeoptans intestinalis]MDY3121904.1 tRNA pseudouridine synthase A [Suipraeoptans intestinalis]MSR94725.1 tRNA pseudouridine synthase A [Suipraeoptans intestinalis]